MVDDLIEELFVVLVKPKIDVVVAWKIVTKGVVKHLLEWSIFIQEQQDIFVDRGYIIVLTMY